MWGSLLLLFVIFQLDITFSLSAHTKQTGKQNTKNLNTVELYTVQYSTPHINAHASYYRIAVSIMNVNIKSIVAL